MSEMIPSTAQPGAPAAPASRETPHLSPNQRAWRRFIRNRLAWGGAWFLGLFLLLVLGWPALLQPAWARHLPAAMTWSAVEISDAQFQSPSRVHWCGTDVHGRDLMARMIHGARISMLVGLFGAGVSLVIGALWGAVAGYVGGRWDSAMMRFVDILYSLPSIVFVIVLIATLDGFLKSWSSPLLTQADLRDVPALLGRLRTDSSPAVRKLVGGFTPGFREMLAAVPTIPARDEVGRQLAAELNLRINAGPWLADRAFEGVSLRSRTLALRSASNGLAESALMNRSVLEDVFPHEIRRHDRWYASALKMIFSPKLGASTQMIYLFIGLGAVSWLTMARIVRGQVLSLRSRAFVDASRALGAGHARILLRHILPNVAGVIVVYLTLTIPSIILYESFLSYLGLGIQPPQASLGSLIAEGAAQINSVRVYWWMILAPAGVLAAVLLALNFIGDGLRDAFDPRVSER